MVLAVTGGGAMFSQGALPGDSLYGVKQTTESALVGLTHWASEWPWCRQASAIVGAAFAGNVDSHVSTRCTDPWTVRASQQGAP